MAEKSLREIDFAALTARSFFPSPSHWEDQVIYFLLVDRFSDGRENLFLSGDGSVVTGGSTPPYDSSANGNAVRTPDDAARWRAAGKRFCGGNLAGLESKLGYLQRLGVTAVWLSPIFKQVNADETYHGYGIQHFLDVDPHFGTREDLKRFVHSAHAAGIRVILDIILNHTGDVFHYQNGTPQWNGQKFGVQGFRDANGSPTLPFRPLDPAAFPESFPDAAVWPTEFQTPVSFTCQGQIRNFDYFPEYADGDFFSLKDLHHGDRIISNGVDLIDRYAPAATLGYLCEVYKFWIAFADIDAFRLDTAKHMDPGAVRFFASSIHEFAEAIGKDNFFIMGEITGGRDFAYERLEVTGLNAALGISDERSTMTGMVKGDRNPAEYFDLFRNSLLVNKESHTWFRDKIVTSVDDHDHVDQGPNKHRFAAGGAGALSVAAMALNATTLGIPCIYYGTEQLFDGEGGGDGADRYIREAMFGGEFGPFRSRGRHAFLEEQPAYQQIAGIHRFRERHLPLRRGRQYLRQTSGDGINFGFPERPNARLLSIVAWSRIFNDVELLCAINTNPNAELTAFVTLDNNLHAAGDPITCLYSTRSADIGVTVAVEPRNGKAIRLTIPAAGFAVYG